MARPVARRGEGRARLLDAALPLFSAHGVSGTSLQMIADELGVTKAAVYHQFPSKDGIVAALADPPMTQLSTLLDRVEALPSASDRSAAVLEGIVDLVLDHRRFSAAMQRDAEVQRILVEHTSWLSHAERLDLALLGPDPVPEARIALALAGGGLLVSAVNAALEGHARDVLRPVMLTTTRRALEPYLP